MRHQKTLAICTATLIVVGNATACFQVPPDLDPQRTTTSEVELKRWFDEPAKPAEVIESSDQSNFLKAVSFDPQFTLQKQGTPQSPLPPSPPAATPALQEPTNQLPDTAEFPAPPFPSAGHSIPQSPGFSAPVPPEVVSPLPPVPAQADSTATTPPDVLSGSASCQPDGITIGQCGVAGSGTCGPWNSGRYTNFVSGTLCDRGCNSWTVTTGAVYMFRGRPNRQPMIFDPLAPAQSMDASNFSFGPQSGFEASATRHRAFGDWDLETRYLGIEDWSALQSRRFDGNPIQINNTPPTFVSGPRRVVSRYSSDLHNFEWNLKNEAAPGLNFLVGFRHVLIDEKLATRFRSLAAPPVSTEDYRVNTRNRLYGLQLGFEKTIIGDCSYCLQAYSRAGVYANDARQRSSLVNYQNPVTEFTFKDRDTQLATVTELGLRMNYKIGQNTNAYAGYRGMWVKGVALASDQIPHTSFAGVNSNIDNSGDVFYHGGTFGLEFRF